MVRTTQIRDEHVDVGTAGAGLASWRLRSAHEATLAGLVIALLLALAALATLAAPVAADPASPDTGSTPAGVAGPDPRAGSLPAHDAASSAATASARPLTRALVRARIEAIDPTGWLARYGDVERRPSDRR